MVSLQPKLNLRVAQKQILTPGLVQMVSVLALNKLELRDMIQAEMVENPVLDELDDIVPVLDDVARREEEPVAVSAETQASEEKKDAFEEIDFGSFFRDYLDPGYRSPEAEAIEKPSFENFLSKPSTLTDHLMWQLGAMAVRSAVREACELVIGNLDEDGYLTASEEELLAAAYPYPPQQAKDGLAGDPYGADRNSQPASNAEVSRPTLTGAAIAERVGTESAAEAAGVSGAEPSGRVEAGCPHLTAAAGDALQQPASAMAAVSIAEHSRLAPGISAGSVESGISNVVVASVAPFAAAKPLFTSADLWEALELVRQMDPPGVAARDLRDCLLAQIKFHQANHERQKAKTGQNGATDEVLRDALAIVSDHLKLVQNRQPKELAKALARPLEAVQAAMEFIRTLDPRPGQRYNNAEPRLIEPDVAFIKQGDEYVVVLNDDDVPQLRLNPTYRRLLNRDEAEKDVRSYIKEKYKSAIQLIKNIEQRKQTILKVCYAIIGRQREFLEKGIDHLVPMMIKEVAEEIGVHPSTVSRAVASKYAHTAQGVFELRYFFSEGVQGPEGGNTSLLILKRRVKKLIEEEDSARPYTDEQITRILQSQGIQVTRRTVAKYREDMRIPSTHQRRVKN
jgi:RNA polymerase sigma-54 factor